MQQKISELKSTLDESEQLKTQISELKIKVDESEKNLQQKILELKSQIDEAVKSKDESEKNLQQTISELKSQVDEAVKSKDESEKLKTKISKLKKEFDDLQKINLTCNEEKKNITNELKKSIVELSTYKNGILDKLNEILKEKDTNYINIDQQIIEKLEKYNKMAKELEEIRQIKDCLESSSDNTYLLKIPGKDNAFINIPNVPSVDNFQREFQNYMKNFTKSPLINEFIINKEGSIKSINESVDFDQNIIKKNYIILIKYLILMFRFYSRDPLFMRYQSIIGYEKKNGGGNIEIYVKSINKNIAITLFKNLYNNNTDSIKDKINNLKEEDIFIKFSQDIDYYIIGITNGKKYDEKKGGFINENGIYDIIHDRIIPIVYEKFKEIVNNLYYLTIQPAE